MSDEEAFFAQHGHELPLWETGLRMTEYSAVRAPKRKHA